LKNINDRAIIRVVIATGISSVVTQLLTIREFLAQFQGNEIVIALIFFNWLILGGIGTRLARVVVNDPAKSTATNLAWLSLALSTLAVLQILAIRQLRDVVFIHGSSVGFYPTWLFSFLTLVPYCLLLGFVLPYSLFVLRAETADYPVARIYITDNIGDISGGALFSFVLVFWVSPLTALFLAHLPLLISIYLLLAPWRRNNPGFLTAVVLVTAIMGGSIGLEHVSPAPVPGKLVYYRETRYGRLAVRQDQEQFTLFEDGVPVFSSQNLSLAEETIHYPLSQLDAIDKVLLISAQGGVLSFSMRGFDNYLAEPQRQKLSSLYNTAAAHFKNVLLLPGQKVFFLCRDGELNADIPSVLAQKGIATAYISGFFGGNLSPARIDRLNKLMDPSTPRNVDNSPYLMRLMFSQWFAKFQTSPLGFFLVIAILTLLYLLRVSREEFVLFSTGCMTMGSEILVIFAFQIYFGYIYLQIGIIVTVFLAGLLPGAWLGNRLHQRGKQVLSLTDGFLIVVLALFILAIINFADHLPVVFYLAFGFAVSLACGFQFPVALYLRGTDNISATRAFSADLIGAACGTLLTSVVLIPYAGILWAAGGLIGLKLISLILIGTSR